MPSIIGATAMGFQGLIRATEDVDLLLRATPDNVQRLRRAFQAAYGEDPSIDEIRESDLLGDYAALRERFNLGDD